MVREMLEHAKKPRLTVKHAAKSPKMSIAAYAVKTAVDSAAAASSRQRLQRSDHR